jgi:hypothetical protein
MPGLLVDVESCVAESTGMGHYASSSFFVFSFFFLFSLSLSLSFLLSFLPFLQFLVHIFYNFNGLHYSIFIRIVYFNNIQHPSPIIILMYSAFTLDSSGSS